MKKQEIFEFMQKNPVFYLATNDGEQPRVRGMLLFRADEDGIIFHTSDKKDLYSQIQKHPKVELCFCGGVMQIRVFGNLEKVIDENLKQEIYNHPTRKFLKNWQETDILDSLVIFRLKNGKAFIWTMEKNFSPKEIIEL